MATEPDQIRAHIEETRGQLTRDISEIQRRIKDATNWRGYFERNLGAILGASFAGGLLLSALTGGSRRR